MSASLINRITINPEIAHGKPTIRNKTIYRGRNAGVHGGRGQH
jgi:hypothetical protein